MTAHFYFCQLTIAFLRRVGCGKGYIFFTKIPIFLFLMSPCKISKPQHKPFWEREPILAIVWPKLFLPQGGMGVQNIFFPFEFKYFCYLGAHLSVQFFLFFQGGRVGPPIFSIGIFLFLLLGSLYKNLKSYDNPLWVFEQMTCTGKRTALRPISYKEVEGNNEQ